jgi:hypothetical protein
MSPCAHRHTQTHTADLLAQIGVEGVGLEKFGLGGVGSVLVSLGLLPNTESNHV